MASCALSWLTDAGEEPGELGGRRRMIATTTLRRQYPRQIIWRSEKAGEAAIPCNLNGSLGFRTEPVEARSLAKSGPRHAGGPIRESATECDSGCRSFLSVF